MRPARQSDSAIFGILAPFSQLRRAFSAAHLS